MTIALEPDAGLFEVLDLAQTMVRDIDGRIRYWSRGAERLYGWTRDEAVGRIAHELLATEFPAPLSEIDVQLLRDAQWHGELRHFRRDGSPIYVASHWALHRASAGRPAMVTEVNNDISSQRQAEDALLRLAAIVASSNDAIIGMTLDGIITDWNAAAASMFGYSEPEAIGQRITMLYPPERMGEEETILDRLRQGLPVAHFETLRRRHSGETFPVSANISPIHDATGAIVGASKIVRDTSEMRDQRRRLDEVQAQLAHVSRLTELGQLVSALVHEVNQPLTAISNYARAVQRLLGAGNTERIPAAVEKIAEQSDRAYQIIQRLRAFVRKGESATQEEDLPATIREAVALAAIGPAAKNASIRTEFAPDAERVVIDRIQVEQVLFNLLRNALEAMQHQADRTVTLRTELADAELVQVSVTDRGPGLSAEVRERLFQPFVTTKPTGLGVGLSVCRAIIEAHGGGLWAEDNPDGGAVFRFTLKRAPTASTAGSNAATPDALPPS